jgi:uncharacterized surface protein with fasciclin (FAS1) repeats
MTLIDEVRQTLACLDEIIAILDSMKAEATARATKGDSSTSLSSKDWRDIIAWLTDAITNERRYKNDFVNAISTNDANKLSISASNVSQSFKYFSDTDLNWSGNFNNLDQVTNEYLQKSKWKSRINPYDPPGFQKIERELGW